MRGPRYLIRITGRWLLISASLAALLFLAAGTTHVPTLLRRGSADPAFGSAVFRARKRSSQIRVFGSAGNRTRSTVRPQRRRCSSAATPQYSAALDQVQLSGFATNPRRTGFRGI